MARRKHVPMTGRYYKTPDGEKGTKVTIKRIIDFANEGKIDPKVVAAARDISWDCEHQDYECEAESIFNWVRDNIRWVRDVHGVETIALPFRTLEMRAGDCDDMTILLAALLMAVGFPVKIVVVANNPKFPKSFSHVFVSVYVDGRDEWVTADPSNPDAYFGWETDAQTRRAEFEIPIE